MRHSARTCMHSRTVARTYVRRSADQVEPLNAWRRQRYRCAQTSTHHSPKSRGREAQFLFFSGTNRYKACYGQRNATFSTNSRFKTSQVSWKFFLVVNPHSEKVSAKETCKYNMPLPVLIVQKIWKLAPPDINSWGGKRKKNKN